MTITMSCHLCNTGIV